MACTATTASKGDKGVGTKFFLDLTDCTQVVDPNADPPVPAGTNAYTQIDCVTEVQPPGSERDEEEDDGCLDVDLILQSIGPRKLTSSNMTYRYIPNSTLDLAVRDAIKNGTALSAVISHRVGSTQVFEWYDVIISQFTPQNIQKREFRVAQVRLTPQTDSYFETTGSNLGTGLS